jgi:hypothetical protein
MQQVDRHIKGLLRVVDVDTLSRDDKEMVRKLKTACAELRLDVRDYEYAQTRAEQIKWAKLTLHNLRALEALVLRMPQVFGSVDVAELGARIDTIKIGVV